MKNLLLLGALVACLCLQSCQCADSPPIGPIEGEEEARTVAPLPAPPGDLRLPA